MADALAKKANLLPAAEHPAIIGETKLSASYGPTLLLKSASDQPAIDFFIKNGALCATIKQSGKASTRDSDKDSTRGKATYVFHRRNSDYKDHIAGTAELSTKYGLIFELTAEDPVAPSPIQ